MLRDPAVAGTFYPACPEILREQLRGFLSGAPRSAGRVRLLMAPHASYAHSGAIAGEAYRLVEIPPLVVLLAPSHYGVGAPLALPRSGSWRTPLGDLEIDAEAAAEIASSHPRLKDDWRAHARDHAIEAQLPFLQARAAEQGRSFRILTLSVATLELEELLAAGRAIAEGLDSLGKASVDESLIVVSTDMSHYLSANEARRADLPALSQLLGGDAEGLHAEVLDHGLTMCGMAPAVVGLEAARRLGAGGGELVRYGHSGALEGEGSEVVSYASLLLAAAP